MKFSRRNFTKHQTDPMTQYEQRMDNRMGGGGGEAVKNWRNSPFTF